MNDYDKDYDLAILHVVDAGPHFGRRVRLTKKAPPGEIGYEIIFEFLNPLDVEDLIEQLTAASLDAWPENE